MISKKIMLESRDGINPLELNQRFEAISQLINNIINGNKPQETPTISSFVNAPHDHSDGANGGQLTVDAIDSEAANDGEVASSDGAGNVVWSNLSNSFLGLSDTPASYSGNGLKVLQVNSTPDAIEAVDIPDKDSYSVDEVSDYTTTSTSLVDVDATNLALTLNATGDVLVLFLGSIYPSTTGMRIYFELDVDGSPAAGGDGIFVWETSNASEILTIGYVWLVTGLSASSHTFKLQWKVSSGTATMPAGAGTSGLDVHPQMIALEVL